MNNHRRHVLAPRKASRHGGAKGEKSKQKKSRTHGGGDAQPNGSADPLAVGALYDSPDMDGRDGNVSEANGGRDSSDNGGSDNGGSDNGGDYVSDETS